MLVAYGYTVKNLRDEYIQAAEVTVFMSTNAFAPGRYLADIFPICACHCHKCTDLVC